MLTNWLLFILLFGVVVFIHELGHFTVAKLCKVYVERFALGFGPALLKKKWGETEYAICAFPLGGYVKMRGEDLEEAKSAPFDPRSFAQIHPLRRIAIVAMGPLSNLILPIFVFTFLFLVGMPTITSQVGWVFPDSPAQKSGIKPGDKVLSVDGRSIWRWADLEESLRKSPGKPVNLLIDRGGSQVTLSVTPKAEKDATVFGDEVSVGKIGVSPNPIRPVMGLRKSSGVAAKAGFQTGDIVVSLDGKPISTWWQFEEEFRRAPGKRVIGIERYLGPVEKQSTIKQDITLPGKWKSLSETDIEEGELYIREVKEGSVAAEKGIRSGDKLVSINSTPLQSWVSFQQRIRQNAGENLVLRVLRSGKTLDFSFVPKEVVDRNNLTQEKEKRRQLGVISAGVPGDIAQKDERYLNPIVALFHGFTTTVEMTTMTLQGLGKLLSGQLSVKKSLGGPISIFYLAGGSYETGGWISFFRMMALLSITLGVINFLPIPILDGGHLLFFLLEAIKGSPVHVRVRELAQQLGLILIIGLMLLTFYVDIERYFLDQIKALFN